MIHIQKIPGDKWICNCYIIHDEKDAIIIDPGSDYDEIRNCLFGFRVRAILATHGHFDHITNVANLAKDYNAPFYIHLGDAKLVKHANLYLTIFHGNQFIQIPKIDHLINGDAEIDFTVIKLAVIHTPGHTEGSVCYSFDNNLFTGDLILKSEIGRTDLPGGNQEKLKQSIKKIHNFFLNPSIFPGHKDDSTLNEVRTINKRFMDIINCLSL